MIVKTTQGWYEVTPECMIEEGILYIDGEYKGMILRWNA